MRRSLFWFPAVQLLGISKSRIEPGCSLRREIGQNRKICREKTLEKIRNPINWSHLRQFEQWNCSSLFSSFKRKAVGFSSIRTSPGLNGKLWRHQGCTILQRADKTANICEWMVAFLGSILSFWFCWPECPWLPPQNDLLLDQILWPRPSKGQALFHGHRKPISNHQLEWHWPGLTMNLVYR